jgi:hypothetical protein
MQDLYKTMPVFRIKDRTTKRIVIYKAVFVLFVMFWTYYSSSLHGLGILPVPSSHSISPYWLHIVKILSIIN